MVLRQWMDKSAPVWMRWVLWFAALFNLYWGGKLIFRSESLWPYGLLVALMGVGYVVAGFQPRRHWSIVFVGLLANVASPIGYFFSDTFTGLPWQNGWAVFFYHILWWVPFALILRKAWEPRPQRRRGPRARQGERRSDEGRPDRRSRQGGQGGGSRSGPQDSDQADLDPRRRRPPRRDAGRREGGRREGGGRDGGRREGGRREGDDRREGGRREGGRFDGRRREGDRRSRPSSDTGGTPPPSSTE